eukprot:TRINITY_DN105369_c0_g1_i1.p1 TRINITY_DN105369_c0_g1~~TRINITY_DN105369_c0_g1_i1.p1  ORF type:complete len:484 (-),score=102.41 TRINITY_DN105369_c0_g1_i1:159-1562(-)
MGNPSKGSEGAGAGSSSCKGGKPASSGAAVRVGTQTFAIEKLLGKGSFGAVWAAQAVECGKEIALKEILCRTEAELRRASTERQLLHCLSRPSGTTRAASLPSLIASEAESAGPGAWLVRLAMTRVPGIPLAAAMKKTKERSRVARPEGDAATLQQRFLAAAHFSCELLRQLSPALERLSALAYHRDVTPRNILVDDAGGPAPKFALVDFGLAVDAFHWQSDENCRDIAGDGLFWPISAWFAFSHGCKALRQHPALESEYKLRLDHHSLGLSALGCLMELCGPLEGPTSPHTPATALPAAVQKLRALKGAWNKYCSNAKRFWQPVYEAFRTGCCKECEALKAAYAQAAVHKVVAGNLKALHDALRCARVACTREASLHSALALFDALLLLVSPGEVHASTAGSWAQVQSILEPACQDYQQNVAGYLQSCSSALRKQTDTVARRACGDQCLQSFSDEPNLASTQTMAV